MSFPVPEQLTSNSNSIELTDFDTEYKVYSLTNCTNESDPTLKKLRGMIFTHDNRLIHSTYYTNEYTLDCLPEIDYSHSLFTVSEEGTMIRLFHNKDKDTWMISTQRKLDAFDSYWGDNTSFGDYFRMALDFHSLSCLDLVNQMDPSRVYIFFLRTSKHTRIVCLEPKEDDEPRLFYIGSTMVGSSLFVPEESTFGNIPRPTLLSIHNEVELRDHIQKIDCFQHQGVLIYDQLKDTYTKIYSDEYNKYKQLRGNEPSVLSRFIQLYYTSSDSVKDLCQLYPQLDTEFASWKEYAIQIEKELYDTYITRYIKKEFIVVDPELHYLLKEIHKVYVQTHKKITIHTIRQVIQNNINVLCAFIKKKKDPK